MTVFRKGYGRFFSMERVGSHIDKRKIRQYNLSNKGKTLNIISQITSYL